MFTLYNTVHYWLVDHPIISHFEWDPNQSHGASPLFLTLTIATYLTLTLLFRRFTHLIPTVSSATLRLVAAAHSLFLCLLSAVMALGTVLSVLHQTPPDNPTYFMCLPSGPGSVRAHGPTFFWGHVFYLSKILEFVDTLLILLSGSRSRRLSFLHVYHHALVVVMCRAWLASRQSMFPVGLSTNACVHVLMYGYYFLSACGYRPTWKKVVTDCQIGQFMFGYLATCVLVYMHFTSGSGCSGMWVYGFSTAFTTSLLVLFRNFHVKNYAHGNLVRINKQL